MKRKFTHTLILLIMILFGASERVQAQFGRVILNEYMPWPNFACGSTAEFVELVNMGPGPVDIGCWIISDGDFAVTIPPGTIMQPNTYFVIAGQAMMIAPCANFTKNVVPDLNWATCNCANTTIPTIGNAWFTDGGFASEQVVLFKPDGTVADAVFRAYPGETSSLITSKAMPGCSSFTFDLDLMPIAYETIGESTGRGNSIARKLDGDCGWVKDTQQTGSETNNTPGERNSLTMTMYITEDINCTGGTARFVVDQLHPEDWFPMDYILGYDSDNDGQFTFNDTYTTGVDATSPDVVISNLPLGYYAINIGPRQGCSYQNFTFAIGPCTTLGYKIHSFNADKFNRDILFTATISGANEVAEVVLEGSVNGRDFFKIGNVNFNEVVGMQDISYMLDGNTEYTYFRLLLVDRNHKTIYSPTRRLTINYGTIKVKLAGNPVNDVIRLYTTTTKREVIDIQLFNSAGQSLYSQKYTVAAGLNQLQIPSEKLQKGVYFLKARVGENYIETFRVLK